MAIYDNRNRTLSAATDVVAVFDENSRQVFSDARPMTARITTDTRYMRHPTETGVLIVDHAVRQPTAIELELLFSRGVYRDGYQTIVRLQQERARLSLQTKSGSWDRLYIETVPVREDPEHFNTLSVRISLIENLVAETPETQLLRTSVRDSNDSSTLSRGQQESAATNAEQSEIASTLYRLLN